MMNARPGNDVILWGAGFAALNVVMYLALGRFWIGGSSFLPLVGEFGPNDAYLFALVVNIGVVAGAAVGAASSGEFVLRLPHRENAVRAILGGALIGIGITLGPGTCTTAFVTGMPMLSVASFISVAGILIGGYLAFRLLGSR